MIAVPGDSLDIILRHATASGVPPPEDELRVGIASHGEGSDVYEGAALRLAQVRRHHPLGNDACHCSGSRPRRSSRKRPRRLNRSEPLR